MTMPYTGNRKETKRVIESCLPVSNKIVIEELKLWLIEELPMYKEFSREEHD